MTREELIDDVLHDLDHGNITRGEAKSKLIAALEKEREGEVVLADGKFNHDSSVVELVVSKNPWEIFNCGFDEIHGRTGQLIFRPTPADKEGV